MFMVLSIHVHWRNCAGACSQTTMDYLYMYTNYKIKGNIFGKKNIEKFQSCYNTDLESGVAQLVTFNFIHM